MLVSVRVSNFKSLVDVEFRPAGINLLVGRNNAGKTNLCHALRFISLTSQGPLHVAADQCAPEPWNLFNVHSARETAEFQVRCRLRFEDEELSFQYQLDVRGERTGPGAPGWMTLGVEREELRVTGGRFKDEVLLDNKEGHVCLRDEESLDGPPYPPSTASPVESTMLSRLYDLETNRRANLFKSYLESWSYYNLNPDQMRTSLVMPMDSRLHSSGANLSSVLYSLHNERPREERALLDALRLVEPGLDVMSFQSPDPQHVYLFFEDRQGHKFGVQSLSEGTLRYMAICYLTIVNRNSENSRGFSPLVMIEEPENGLFVGHLKPLFEKIDPSGQQGQFIFTSHDPYFIDLFDGELDGVHVVKSVGSHSTIAKPDAGRIRDLLGSFSLGEMHFRELLE